jgi:hypothetical protein
MADSADLSLGFRLHLSIFNLFISIKYECYKRTQKTKLKVRQTRTRAHGHGLRARHPFFDPVICLQLIQLKQKGLYLEVLDMSFFLQILVSAIATVSCIVSHNAKGIRHTVLVCVSSCFVGCNRTFLLGIAGTYFRQG